MKRKSAKKHTRRRSSTRGSNDAKQRRKFNQGGRIEAYTLGEALGNKRWP